MKKTISIVLAFVLLLGVLTGCAGTAVVYYSDCTCPAGSHTPDTTPGESAGTETAEGAVKTGLYIGTKISDSVSASAEANGKAAFDVTLVAVTVTDEGVIDSCVIDSIGADVAFDASGTVTADLTAQVLSKTELGDSYGMKQYGNAKYEWYEQAAALAKYAEGKTVEQLRSGAVNESGYAADADLASTATIYLGGYVSAIEEAVNNAKHLGAQAGDELRLASISGIGSSVSADAQSTGTAQLDVDVTAVTLSGGIITSCYIDSLQAKVSFDHTGTITADLTAPVLTKNQLGENYGMKQYAGSAYEWNEQAAAFAAYVTGKTASQVAGIAVNEKTAPADVDLASTVTISIAGFQALIAKAMQ